MGVKRAIVGALLLLLPQTLHAEPAPVENFTLENGLEVVVLPNHRIPAVSQMLWFRVGAGDDPPGKSGLAHFHEHAMFLGTLKHPAHAYAETIARQGGQQNAFTSADSTAYYIDIAKEQLPLAMEMESDRLRGLAASDDDIVKEKQVIIEERRMRIENNPSALLSEQVAAALFRNHPYHMPIIGWMHEMDGLTKDDVMNFHRTWYHPNNAILILSGDITAAEAKPLVRKYYGDLPKAVLPERNWKTEPPQNTERRITLHHKNVKQPQWERTYAVASAAYGKKEQALPLFMLAELMGSGKSSRLYRALVVEQKLATEIDVDYSGFTRGPGEFEISAVPQSGIDRNTLEEAVDRELALILKSGFSEKEITRARNLLKSESIYARDGLSSMAHILGTLLTIGLDRDYFIRWPEMIEAVTPEQIATAAKDALIPNQSVTAWLLPEGK